VCAERDTDAAHAALRTQLVQRLAGRGEPLFTTGARCVPAAALFAARHTRVASPSDRIEALVNVVAALWEHGAATASDLARLAPRVGGGVRSEQLVARLAEGRPPGGAEFDAAKWLESTHAGGEEVVLELLFGARLVLLESAWQRAPHAPVARAIV
jgi:hypothetical protein